MSQPVSIGRTGRGPAWLLNGRLLRVLAIALICSVVDVTPADACNIPVFRYALERWKPDSSELIVFYEGDLSPAQQRIIRQLHDATRAGGGNANAELFQIDVAGTTDRQRLDLWRELKSSGDPSLPYLVARTRLGGRHVNHWHGALDLAAAQRLVGSPVREELANRLMTGHSVVWLVLGSADAAKTAEATAMLKKSFEDLTQRVKLPEGIGLPGSELYSNVPLVLKFSTLTIPPDDPAEIYLRTLLGGIRSEAHRRGQPLLVPVFGRGRALEVIPASDINEALVTDLTLFLSGACSCQVKEQNPGFDLLIDADWDGTLFDGAENAPPDRADTPGQRRGPVLVPIPSGR